MKEIKNIQHIKKGSIEIFRCDIADIIIVNKNATIILHNCKKNTVITSASTVT